MSFSYSNMAKVGANSSLALGQAQASSLGLGQTEAQALGVANLMENSVIGGSNASSASAPTTKAEFGASVVTATLNNLNKSGKKTGSITPSFEFQTSVLNAGLMGKGGIINSVG